jgi:hypothetical protein
MPERPWNDPIVEDVRRVRDEYASSFNYDLEAIRRDLEERELRGEFKTVRRIPRPPRMLPRTGT